MLEIQGCNPGLRATVSLVVRQEDTALAMRSGDVPVLASPRLVALAEEAAVKALGDSVPEGKTSVGAWMELEHTAPSHVGATVVADAVLLGVHGRRLEFSISVREDGKEIAHLRHRRVLVSRSRFEPSQDGSANAPDGDLPDGEAPVGDGPAEADDAPEAGR